MNHKDLTAYLKPEYEKAINLMESALCSDIELLNSTNKSILTHGGKHLRLLLTILMAKVCSGGSITEDTCRFAAAVELLHNATLLHDDVADDSKSRRGFPTTMSVLGGKASVLLGDYWLVKAVDKILQADNDANEVIRIFSKTLSHLAEGEMLQLQKAVSGDTSLNDYLRIIHNKTASLFKTASLCGAISVGSGEQQRKAACEYAVNLGLAFQVKDDILDYEGDESLGKPVGQDLQERKITMPLLCAFEDLPKQEEEQIRAKIRNISERPSYQQEIVDFVHYRKGTDKAYLKLAEFTDKAIISLRAFKDSREKELLKDLALYSAQRKV